MSGLPTQDGLKFETLTTASTETILQSYNVVTIINNGENSITIGQSSDNYAATISLTTGQGITFTSGSNLVLPQLKITTGTGTCSVNLAIS
jgi:hypothetical protein|tara:strand:- start:2413 stop:2685 length:273 start_codon:yes stop_codon:yes gene_type:complete